MQQQASVHSLVTRLPPTNEPDPLIPRPRGLCPLFGARLKGDAGEVLTGDAGLEILTEEECLALLQSSDLGRIAVSIGAIPAIFPVNYVIVDGRILFHAEEGTKLWAATKSAVVAFQVDMVDEAAENGWSVLAVGRAEEVKEPTVVDYVMKKPVRPWAPGTRDRVIAIHPEFLSGRRFVAG
jgi:uncharacterized protein